MNKKFMLGILIVLMIGLSASYASPIPGYAQTDEELMAVGIITYGLVHLYEGLNDWGFMPVPGITGKRSEDGSFSYTFKKVDPDGDGLFVLDGTNKATLSKNKIHEILDITIQDDTSTIFKVYITASGLPDDDLVMTSMKINGKTFTQSQIETMLETDFEDDFDDNFEDDWDF